MKDKITNKDVTTVSVMDCTDFEKRLTQYNAQTESNGISARNIMRNEIPARRYRSAGEALADV